MPQPQETQLAAQQISFLCMCVCVCVCGEVLGVVPPAAGTQTVKHPFQASSSSFSSILLLPGLVRGPSSLVDVVQQSVQQSRSHFVTESYLNSLRFFLVLHKPCSLATPIPWKPQNHFKKLYSLAQLQTLFFLRCEKQLCCSGVSQDALRQLKKNFCLYPLFNSKQLRILMDVFDTRSQTATISFSKSC